jgi:hypothetical protein
MTNESPRTLNPRRLSEAPPELFDLLCDCKEENPALRPESAAVVVRRLESILTFLQTPSYLKTEVSIKKEIQNREFVKTNGGFSWESLYLPHHTEIRMKYKKEFYYAKVEGDKILYNDQSLSPNKFANEVSDSSTNAWRCLYIKRPDDAEWHLADKLRKQR